MHYRYMRSIYFYRSIYMDLDRICSYISIYDTHGTARWAKSYSRPRASWSPRRTSCPRTAASGSCWGPATAEGRWSVKVRVRVNPYIYTYIYIYIYMHEHIHILYTRTRLSFPRGQVGGVNPISGTAASGLTRRIYIYTYMFTYMVRQRRIRVEILRRRRSDDHGLYKIQFHLVLCVQTLIIPVIPLPICITHTTEIRLSNFFHNVWLSCNG